MLLEITADRALQIRVDARHVIPVPDTCSPARFVNELTRRTGCGLILDIETLERASQSGPFNLGAFFDELDFRPVRAVRIGSTAERYLADYVLRRAPNVASSIEISPEEPAPFVPGSDAPSTRRPPSRPRRSSRTCAPA